MELGKSAFGSGWTAMSAAQAQFREGRRMGIRRPVDPREPRSNPRLYILRGALPHRALIVATDREYYARDAMAMANGQRTLAEQSGGPVPARRPRFASAVVKALRGHSYASRWRRCAPICRRCAGAPYRHRSRRRSTLTVVARWAENDGAVSELADGAHRTIGPPKHTRRSARSSAPARAMPGRLGWS